MTYKCPKCKIEIKALVPNKVDELKCQFCKVGMKAIYKTGHENSTLKNLKNPISKIRAFNKQK